MKSILLQRKSTETAIAQLQIAAQHHCRLK